jgi:ribosome modulation factor
VIRERFATAQEAVSSIDALRGQGARVAVAIASTAIRPDTLTASERLILVKDGWRNAATGNPEDSCPYTDDLDRRKLWLEGYHRRR